MLHFYDINNISFDLLDENILVVNKLAPLKLKYIRAKQGAFMNKDLRKVIMKRSKLRNSVYRVKTEETRIACNKQRNLVIKTKISYFNSLNPSLVSANKSFWKTVNPAFSDTICSRDIITIIDNNHIISDDIKIA